MPVEIEGETIWVECVPGGAGDRQVGKNFSWNDNLSGSLSFEYLVHSFIK